MSALWHRLLHVLGMNPCAMGPGYLDYHCVGCGKVYPASDEFKAAVRRACDRELAAGQSSTAGRESP